MDRTGHLAKSADVPSHKDPNKAPDDYIAWEKSLRACYVCKLIKSEAQFFESGCENCHAFLDLEGDRGRVREYTTPNFSGMISVMDPSTSWTTKWLHLTKCVPGCYTLVVNEDMPNSLQEILEDRGIGGAHIKHQR